MQCEVSFLLHAGVAHGCASTRCRVAGPTLKGDNGGLGGLVADPDAHPLFFFGPSTVLNVHTCRPSEGDFARMHECND